MLIAALIVVSIVAFIFLVIGIAIGRSGREQLRIEIASLRERLAGAESRYTESRRITGELLEVVKGNLGLTQKAGIVYHYGQESVERARADYVAPTVEHCSECSVAVRAESWPQPCPNCGTMINGGEWPDVVG